MEETLDKEIIRRLKRRLKMSKSRYIWVMVSNILGVILLYPLFLYVRGTEYAIENVFLAIISVLGIDGVGALGYFGYVIFNEIPSDIYKEQKKIIDERLPDRLFLNIELPPNIMTSGVTGGIIKVTSLWVTSVEKKKIVELQAFINFDHYYYRKDFDYAAVDSYQLNSPLVWLNDKDEMVTESELLPNIGKRVVIGELVETEYKDTEQKVWIMRTGSNPVPWADRFTMESIYRILIRFQGKLEGEYIRKEFIYEDAFYAKPDEQQIDFLDRAKKAYSINEKLLKKGGFGR